jgi:glycosyltransferase involved in cell wall biosynthesis
VSERLKRFAGLEADVMRAPMNDRHLFTGGDHGDYIFAGGRINAMKRQHLLVEAMATADPAVKLVVAGPPDVPTDAARLVELVDRLGLSERVHLDLRFLERETYAAYLNGAAAVAYLPFAEDSYGYVTMEAAEAGKPVITVSDSGGVLGLVRDGETGWVVEPDPGSLAKALSEAINDEPRARELGAAARDLWIAHNVNWEFVIEMLLS